MAETVVTSIEAPSGKDVAYENFPVGSWLLPARLRPHVAVFYAFARAIDDIADDPQLPPEEKIARLTGFEAALLGREKGDGFAKAHAMRQTLAASGISARHCLDLISAFKQDATQARYRRWDDLIDYCNRSAAPVGRFLLDLHGGGRNGYTAADALCNALQVINHLQDCQEDYRLLNRVYLPCDWLAEAGTAVEDLDRPSTTPALRRVIDRMLDATDSLLAVAQRLPAELKSRRLGMESSAILAIARLLVQRLRAGDPLAGRIALSKAEYAWCCVRGAGAALR
ncbi:MAG: squalene synthase HpnC [Defluviicoccus sp.]|nr:squalene synthase HpnC [Defluviicoccus sp.]MDG4593013.1 squalene synthase HpnC [Defluviicoccus sp.]MDS4071820.1 squalene synthase HpnC [Defluviicoccus sp.]